MIDFGSGRFAPSPTGDLHVGNLRTALASWLDCRSRGAPWLVRFEDLDQAVATVEAGERQLQQLAALGMEPDVQPLWQSRQPDRYTSPIDSLVASGRTYPCYCSRREIREAIAAAVNAPNGPESGLYPGTCAALGSSERARRAQFRPPALRFRSDQPAVDFHDDNFGAQSFMVDDFVIRRNDGVPAYNLVVVVDDNAAAVGSVVRADDLLSSTARQILVGEALGYPVPRYAHVPLVVNADGVRLSKRDRSITLDDLAADGVSAGEVLERLAVSMGVAAVGERPSAADLVDRWGSVHVTGWRNTWPLVAT
ncbi:MAG: tRNA glutamyl-Q(34) synthetase GluQRS [Acidimicrobiales bacterium]|nr:tRNA glutamyl-Q(34) synthetase GluQRS [Acidimicrobiales bacterium]